jgi:hypothetical protein
MYLLNWRERNDFEKPVMAFGRGSSGKQLDRSETLNVLPSRPEGFVPNGR